MSALLVGASPSLPRTVAGAPLVVFVGLQIAAALGEEIGWRGFMQRLGETVARPGVVTVVLGVLFGATHLGNWPLGAEFMVWFTASSVLMCLGIVTVWRGGFWQRMLPATIIHAGCNLALFSLLDAAQGLPASWLLVVPGGLALLTVAGLRWLSGSVFEQVPDVVGGERTSDPVPALHDVLE